MVDEGIDCCKKGLIVDNENENLKNELKKLTQKKLSIKLIIG
jgi:hypothetical protein